MDKASPKFRSMVIRAVQRLDTRIGKIYERHDRFEEWGELTDEAYERIRQLKGQRKRLVGYLKDTGGLPKGMTEEY